VAVVDVLPRVVAPPGGRGRRQNSQQERTSVVTGTNWRELDYRLSCSAWGAGGDGQRALRVNPIAIADGAGVPDESTNCAGDLRVLWRTCAGPSARHLLQLSSRQHPAALIDEKQRTYR